MAKTLSPHLVAASSTTRSGRGGEDGAGEDCFFNDHLEVAPYACTLLDPIDRDDNLKVRARTCYDRHAQGSRLVTSRYSPGGRRSFEEKYLIRTFTRTMARGVQRIQRISNSGQRSEEEKIYFYTRGETRDAKPRFPSHSKPFDPPFEPIHPSSYPPFAFRKLLPLRPALPALPLPPPLRGQRGGAPWISVSSSSFFSPEMS